MATTSVLRIGPADHGRTMTLEAFLDAKEEPGYLYELARGVVEVTEVPGDDHGQVVCNLYRGLRDYDRGHPGVIRRFGGGAEFRLWSLAMISGRNPDVAVVLQHAPIGPRGRRYVDLAIEVVSVGGEDRDYLTKREEYLTYGLREYWIVDPLARRVTVLARDVAEWVDRSFQDDQVIASYVLPGLAMKVSDLWVDLDGE
jgi:Uma2 family endonuclease